jgi:hypothetical protein
MDRARQPDPRRSAPGRRIIRLILGGSAAAVTTVAACRGLTVDPGRVVALELPAPPASLAVGDTVRLAARALNALGAEISDADIDWIVVDTGAVGFTLDGDTGLVTGIAPGTGRVAAQHESLRSDPLRITVTEPLPPQPATPA